VAAKSPQEVSRYFSVGRGILRAIPAAISLGGIDLLAPARLHSPLPFQPSDVVPITFRPAASWTSRREALQPATRVVWSGLAVNPTPAKGLVERLGVGERPHTAVLLKEPQPDSV